ncbi:MAG: aspartate kinase [Candidatus Eisenbacteria bacterium]|nr:aspartate kinase [Candidatus Eisenbacteria bacterium]
MGLIVRKYGGTSLEGRDRIMNVAERVAALRAEGHDVVVVVSARGGTTDLLLEEARAITPAPVQRELDMLMTAGERISMSLLAIALNAIGCPAISFTGSQVGIITDTRHTAARILEVRPHRVRKELERGAVVVVGGFQGVSTTKEVTTLGRGGSDTTAVALAAALEAERCEILTDVDAVYTADPRRVPEARPVSELSYEDMAELARFGATVLKEDAILFAERNGIALSIGASDRDVPGTIVLERPACDDGVTAVTHLTGAWLVVSDENRSADAVSRLEDSGLRPVATFSVEGRTAVAVEGAPGIARPDGALDVTLVCLTGCEAGSPRSMRAILSGVERAGGRIVAAAGSARTARAAVETETPDEVLRAVHEELFYDGPE